MSRNYGVYIPPHERERFTPWIFDTAVACLGICVLGVIILVIAAFFG